MSLCHHQLYYRKKILVYFVKTQYVRKVWQFNGITTIYMSPCRSSQTHVSNLPYRTWLPLYMSTSPAFGFHCPSQRLHVPSEHDASCVTHASVVCFFKMPTSTRASYAPCVRHLHHWCSSIPSLIISIKDAFLMSSNPMYYFIHVPH